jgi:DNA-binding NarL/FixJ family response regulator
LRGAPLLSIEVLLADNAEIMRKMIRNLLKEDPEIPLVGEASNFTEALRLTHQLKPRIIVMDVHMSDESNVTPQDIRSQLSASNARVLEISIWNDEDTKAIANSFGAIKLLDKMKLETELIPAIKQCAQGSSEDAFPSLG